MLDSRALRLEPPLRRTPDHPHDVASSPAMLQNQRAGGQRERSNRRSTRGRVDGYNTAAEAAEAGVVVGVVEADLGATDEAVAVAAAISTLEHSTPSPEPRRYRRRASNGATGAWLKRLLPKNPVFLLSVALFNQGGGGVSGSDWFGTARVRVGYGFDRVLVYATGGIAFTDGGNNNNGFFGITNGGQLPAALRPSAPSPPASMPSSDGTRPSTRQQPRGTSPSAMRDDSAPCSRRRVSRRSRPSQRPGGSPSPPSRPTSTSVPRRPWSDPRLEWRTPPQ